MRKQPFPRLSTLLRETLGAAALLAAITILPTAASAVETADLGTPVSVYGSWHCGNDYCTWGTVRVLTEFDAKNHWLIDRGDGRPSVNLVVLSFVHPLRLLNRTNDAQTLDGIPRGMTSGAGTCA